MPGATVWGAGFSAFFSAVFSGAFGLRLFRNRGLHRPGSRLRRFVIVGLDLQFVHGHVFRGRCFLLRRRAPVGPGLCPGHISRPHLPLALLRIGHIVHLVCILRRGGLGGALANFLLIQPGGPLILPGPPGGRSRQRHCPAECPRFQTIADCSAPCAADPRDGNPCAPSESP